MRIEQIYQTKSKSNYIVFANDTYICVQKRQLIFENILNKNTYSFPLKRISVGFENNNVSCVADENGTVYLLNLETGQIKTIIKDIDVDLGMFEVGKNRLLAFLKYDEFYYTNILLYDYKTQKSLFISEDHFYILGQVNTFGNRIIFFSRILERKKSMDVIMEMSLNIGNTIIKNDKIVRNYPDVAFNFLDDSFCVERCSKKSKIDVFNKDGQCVKTLCFDKELIHRHFWICCGKYFVVETDSNIYLFDKNYHSIRLSYNCGICEARGSYYGSLVSVDTLEEGSFVYWIE